MGRRIWQLLPAMYTSAMAVLIQMEMESAATIQSFTPRSKITWKLGRLAASPARAGLFHSLGWRRYTSSTSGWSARYRSNQERVSAMLARLVAAKPVKSVPAMALSSRTSASVMLA